MDKIKSKTSNLNFPLKKIGNFIKEARVSNNQSLSELATDLKISIQQLNAIEEGREDLLPEGIFVKAMIKKISERLKLDTSFIESELENPVDENNLEEIIKEVNNSKEAKNSQKSPFAFIVLIAISGVIGYLSSSLIFNYSFNKNIDTNQRELKGLNNF